MVLKTNDFDPPKNSKKNQKKNHKRDIMQLLSADATIFKKKIKICFCQWKFEKTELKSSS